MKKLMRLSLAALLVVAAFSVSAAEPKKGGDSAASVEKSPQAAAFLAWVKAVKAKDFEAWKKVVPAEASKQLAAQAKEAGEKPTEMLEMIGMMIPDENKASDLKVDGNKATLSVIGKMKGGTKTHYGTIEMILEGGSWRVAKQSWLQKDK